MSEINRTNKDRLFRLIFGRPENKAWTLDLYNAVNHTSYDDPDAIQITTIDDALYMSMKNDLSFLIMDTMNFYEQQSTYNPNMPMRMLIYAGMVYSKFVEEETNRINLYSSMQQRFPTPRLICFYNGLKEEPDCTVLRLADAFAPGGEPDLDAKVTMLNINFGRNQALLDAYTPLNEYSLFISKYRDYCRDGLGMEEAVGRAITDLPEDSKLREYLTANKAEVTRMCITEYDEKRTMELFREEGRAEGREEGRVEGRVEGRAEGREEGVLQTLWALVKDNILPVNTAAERVGMSVDEFKAKASALMAELPKEYKPE